MQMETTPSIKVRKQKIRKRHTKGRLIVFLVLALLILLAAVFAEQICPYYPYAQDLKMALKPPSLQHLCGTDRYGRDLFSRVIIGSTASIFSTLLLVAVITVVGTAVGIFTGYHGGLADTIVMRISDVFLAFPGLIFAMAFAAILQGGLSNAVLALALIGWPKYARIARSETLSIKENVYISASKLAGSSSLQIIVRHILPNILGPVLVTSMLDIGTQMVELAGLSFLGLGAKPPMAEWGSMMSDSRSMLQTYPWLVISPGVAIFIVVVVFNLLADTVRDYMDPSMR